MESHLLLWGEGSGKAIVGSKVNPMGASFGCAGIEGWATRKLNCGVVASSQSTPSFALDSCGHLPLSGGKHYAADPKYVVVVESKSSRAYKSFVGVRAHGKVLLQQLLIRCVS